MWDASPILFNTISAIFSAGVFIFFTLSLAKINCSKSLLGAFALVFIPVVYINSTTSIDYIWALFFVLGSFYFALDHKFILAGVFLGLAIGCRLTSAAMIVPIGILAYYQTTSRTKSILTFLAWTFIVGSIVFIPVIYVYKATFITFYEHEYPFYLTIIKKASIGSWGFLGSIAIIISGIFVLFKFREIKRLIQARDPGFLANTGDPETDCTMAL